MKKFIILPMFALCAMAANAQDFDSKPTVTIDNEQEDLHFTVGARFMADAAWYHNDYTPMQSGATIADARIRTSLTYQDWYFYADFGFGGGKFSQKNIFLRYNQKDNKGGNHDIQVGYYNNAAGSMAPLSVATTSSLVPVLPTPSARVVSWVSPTSSPTTSLWPIRV